MRNEKNKISSQGRCVGVSQLGKRQLGKGDAKLYQWCRGLWKSIISKLNHTRRPEVITIHCIVNT